VTTIDGERSNLPRVGRGVLDEVFVLVLAGIPTGVVVAGVGSRLAMLVLRFTSDSSVIGMQSDDDFTIGRFTLGGTYNLLVIGAVVGIIGAAAYQWVRPWLIGPRWFRHATVGLASGAVVGSMLIHADGIDFRALTPTWLAIAVFVALPGVFGLSIAWAVDRVDRTDSFAHRGRARWYVAAACVLLFPPTLVVLAVSAAVLLAWVSFRELRSDRPVGQRSAGLTLCMRALWLGVALVGLVVWINDVREIASVT
jgi:hypothetical protein